jgi:hypothetical protein
LRISPAPLPSWFLPRTETPFGPAATFLLTSAVLGVCHAWLNATRVPLTNASNSLSQVAHNTADFTACPAGRSNVARK